MNNTMIEFIENNPYGHQSQRILESSPFYYSLKYAREYDCDLSVLNGEGIGNIVIYTRLIEELSFSKGRALKLLTAPIQPQVGIIDNEDKYPIWKNNPFISEIINADEIDKKIMQDVNREQDNFCQFNHFIENLCSVFGLRPRKLKPSLFLTTEEMKWAIAALSGLPRPIVCLHPSGKSSVFEESSWYIDNWLNLIKNLDGIVSFIQIGKFDYDNKKLPIFFKDTSIRQMMALIWASDIFVGFDSCPAHIATAFDKPSLVLWNILRKNPLEEPFQTGFGPASLLRWAYPQNKNIMLLGEKDNEILSMIIEFVHEQLNLINRQSKLLASPAYQKWMKARV